jgi:hypothetical protein
MKKKPLTSENSRRGRGGVEEEENEGKGFIW